MNNNDSKLYPLLTPHLQPAPQLNGFVFDKKLGNGTYATVYKAYSKTNNEVFAIKCIKKSSLNKASTENLLREIKILKHIKHEFIVQLIDFHWDDNYIYLIMEYCPGGDLSSFIKTRRTIPEKYVRRFVQQIATALKHLHSKGIAHMDLKPQNILLTSVNNPSLKLADFGFAQYMRGSNVARSLRGSPLYMAPEILKNKVYDSKVDLWSVGVILHEVIFGYAPFVSNSLDELEAKILADTPIEIPTHIMLSETCKDLLRRLLQRNPTSRISFDEFFNHPFVDLEHMASAHSLPKAMELLNKATRYDQRGDYLLAQKFYLQSIEYLIPAIQYEKDHKKKQEIREKANVYLKRAEEIANLIKPKKANNDNEASSLPDVGKININVEHSRPRAESLSNANQATNAQANKRSISDDPANYSFILPLNVDASDTTTARSPFLNNSTFTNVSMLDPQQPDQLVNRADDDKLVKAAINQCLAADDKLRGVVDNPKELCEQYEKAISIILPYARQLPKGDFSRVLKLNIERWLTNAEVLKDQGTTSENEKNDANEKLELLKARESMKEDDDSPTTCILS